MANPEHLEILRQGVETWNDWRQQNDDIYPDLSGEHLSYLNLSLIDFHEANLSGAYLEKARLGWASLLRANLEQAVMRGISFNNANLYGAQLRAADLRRADLSEATLYDANLSDANLTGAKLINASLDKAMAPRVNFDKADLRGAHLRLMDMSGGSLRHVQLTGATLWGVNLQDAKMSHADLREASLSDVILVKADLRSADLSGAKVSGLTFGNNPLTSVRGLSTLEHKGPSNIDRNTLVESRGKLPVEFLRGCGFHNWEIETYRLYDPSISQAKVIDIVYKVSELRSDPFVQFYSCFISYSHADRPFARRLHDALQRRGVRCWLDEHQLLPGDDIFEQVDRGIRLWDKVLLCCSKASLKSWWVDDEITKAYQKEQALMKERGGRCSHSSR